MTDEHNAMFIFMILQIHPIELSTVSDVKLRRQDVCDPLLASSPILNLSMSFNKLIKPVNVVLPVPPNPNKHKRERPSTAGAAESRGSKSATLNGRPKTAFIATRPKNEGIVHLVKP